MTNIPSTKPKELEKFINKLMKNAPKDYQPWLFPVQKNNKAPGTQGYSWKSQKAQLTPKQAKKRLKKGKNIGISGRANDPLILVDIDNPDIEHELKPTLKIRSRSRVGTHAIYWAHPEDKTLPRNITTDKGEVRSKDQYVVAPGSYVPCTKKELTEKVEQGEITEKQKKKVLKDPEKGLYTIDNDKPINQVKLEELPQVFIDKVKKDKKNLEKQKHQKKDINPKKINGNKSALFKLDIQDVVPSYAFNGRNPHPLHPSDTGKNFSVSQGVAHCWRHCVSLNPLQYLCVEAGYLQCHEAGTGHKNAPSPSEIVGDNRAIWEAWLHAKKEGYIDENDPVPIRAIHYIVEENDLRNEKNHEWKLDTATYNKALKIIQEEY